MHAQLTQRTISRRQTRTNFGPHLNCTLLDGKCWLCSWPGVWCWPNKKPLNAHTKTENIVETIVLLSAAKRSRTTNRTSRKERVIKFALQLAGRRPYFFYSHFVTLRVLFRKASRIQANFRIGHVVCCSPSRRQVM